MGWAIGIRTMKKDCTSQARFPKVFWCAYRNFVFHIILLQFMQFLGFQKLVYPYAYAILKELLIIL